MILNAQDPIRATPMKIHTCMALFAGAFGMKAPEVGELSYSTWQLSGEVITSNAVSVFAASS